MDNLRCLRLRYPARCAACGSDLARGAEARWDPRNKLAYCSTCPAAPGVRGTAPAVEDGSAGGSARRELDRRRQLRESRIRKSHRHLGGLILAVTSEPQTTRAWAKGAAGEEQLGRLLDQLRGHDCFVLHDRRVPGSKANLDHLVVSPSGVFVVDSKHYTGRVQRRDCGGLLRSDVRLH